MPRVGLIFALTVCTCLLLHFGGVRSMSDSYGQNPQHEFGAVWGQVLSPLIPFWNLEGDAFANQDFVRLVPDRQSKRGGMWNTEPNRFQSWEATFSIHVHGVSVLGADGLAFWYTQETSKLDGGFFGFTDQFTGLGIVIDTYDNDNTGLHPLLVAIKNDGTKKYTHSHDEGEGDATNMEIGHCQLPIRNLAGTSIIKVIYRGRQLTVETQLYGATTFTHCLTATNIDLPPRYHFGFTAATGQLADNHDVYGFSIRNLDPNGPAIDSQRVFSSYDKYQIAEFLSKIYYEVSQQKPGDGAAGGTDVAQLLQLVRAVEKVDQDLKGISITINALDRKLGAGGQVVAAKGDGADSSFIASEFSSLKQSINSLTQRIATLRLPGPGEPPQQPSTFPSQQPYPPGQGFPFNANAAAATAKASSGFSFLSVFFYIFIVVVVLGLAYVAFLFYRVKSEKEKKFF